MVTWGIPRYPPFVGDAERNCSWLGSITITRPMTSRVLKSYMSWIYRKESHGYMFNHVHIYIYIYIYIYGHLNCLIAISAYQTYRESCKCLWHTFQRHIARFTVAAAPCRVMSGGRTLYSSFKTPGQELAMSDGVYPNGQMAIEMGNVMIIHWNWEPTKKDTPSCDGQSWVCAYFDHIDFVMFSGSKRMPFIGASLHRYRNWTKIQLGEFWKSHTPNTHGESWGWF